VGDGWRFVATRMHGDGTETPLAADLPLQGARVTSVLSGTGSLQATISPEVARLRTSTGPVFVPWSTAVYAERDGVLVGGGILTDPLELDGDTLQMDCAGVTEHLAGTPYVGEHSWVGVEAWQVVVHVWEHVQAQPLGDLGVTVSVDHRAYWPKVGTVTEPFVLAEYATDDLGRVVDDLAKSTGMDYVETLAWDGGTPRHGIELGGRRGRRRVDDGRFVVGENVTMVPRVDEGVGYASEVLLLGAGEGRAMVRARASRHGETRLRRVLVHADKAVRTTDHARSEAAVQLAKRAGVTDVTEVAVRGDVPALGDQFRLVGSGTGWAGDLDVWVRVLAVSTGPDSDSATLTVRNAAKDWES
jgi:hypothetical protein